MKIVELEKLLTKINFDEHYVEATFQFQLLMELASKYDKKIIFPERSIVNYISRKLKKKEIDIVIEHNKGKIAIELKMPMKGQAPEQMFSFIKDINFLEELKDNGFNKCFFIAVTKDKKFWEGGFKNKIFKYFRQNKETKKTTHITGIIYKPTGKGKDIDNHKISGKYQVEWKNLKDDFKYFILEI